MLAVEVAVKPLVLKLTCVQEYDGADGRHMRLEEWTLSGGDDEIDPKWRDESLGAVACRFRLCVVDGVVNPHLTSFGGNYWPSAWPRLFRPVHQGTCNEVLAITDDGLQLRKRVLATAQKAACAHV